MITIRTTWLLSFVIIAMSCAQAQSSSSNLLGKWKTIDDETGRVKSIVDVTERNGKYYGKVVELFRLPEEDPNPICSDCKDDRKDMPALGMEIVRDMAQKGTDSEWENGTICDPKNGKVYDCEMWIDSDRPNELKVRGYIYFLFRTQTWMRQ